MRRVLRKLRIQYAGAIYHVMNRGAQREDVFRDDTDREKLLEKLRRKLLRALDGNE